MRASYVSFPTADKIKDALRQGDYQAGIARQAIEMLRPNPRSSDLIKRRDRAIKQMEAFYQSAARLGHAEGLARIGDFYRSVLPTDPSDQEILRIYSYKRGVNGVRSWEYDSDYCNTGRYTKIFEAMVGWYVKAGERGYYDKKSAALLSWNLTMPPHKNLRQAAAWLRHSNSFQALPNCMEFYMASGSNDDAVTFSLRVALAKLDLEWRTGQGVSDAHRIRISTTCRERLQHDFDALAKKSTFKTILATYQSNEIPFILNLLSSEKDQVLQKDSFKKMLPDEITDPLQDIILSYNSAKPENYFQLFTAMFKEKLKEDKFSAEDEGERDEMLKFIEQAEQKHSRGDQEIAKIQFYDLLQKSKAKPLNSACYEALDQLTRVDPEVYHFALKSRQAIIKINALRSKLEQEEKCSKRSCLETLLNCVQKIFLKESNLDLKIKKHEFLKLLEDTIKQNPNITVKACIERIRCENLRNYSLATSGFFKSRTRALIHSLINESDKDSKESAQLLSSKGIRS